MTQEAFDRLLARLDADRDKAGQKYVCIRHKIVKYFEWYGAPYPDREADETINRVARRIGEGQEINNLNAYFYGVARLVFAESVRARQKEQEAVECAPPLELSEPDTDTESEKRRSCLDLCLRALSKEKRDLIMEYYQDEKGKKIERRRRLANLLGVTLNTLRLRAHRIRSDLETCVRQCIEQHA
jgi:DNA-directed RNA polymerase specialized sigma24 family protein